VARIYEINIVIVVVVIIDFELRPVRWATKPRSWSSNPGLRLKLV